MKRCPDDMGTPGTNDALDYSDSDTDESYNPVDIVRLHRTTMCSTVCYGTGVQLRSSEEKR